MTESKRPVLATGMHRSGTSWLGHMLCAGGAFVNVEESLSPINRQTVLPRPESTWYTYTSVENEAQYIEHYRDALALRLHPIQDLRRMRWWSRDPFRVAQLWATTLAGRARGRATLFRDPFAIFSVEWFVERLGCRAVIVVRHPAGVVSSLKRLNADFDFRAILGQELLMRRLAAFRPEMEAALDSPTDVVGNGSLLWKTIYGFVAELPASSAIHIVRHEDLSLDPEGEYGRLYETLGLPYTARARSRIRRSTDESNPAEVSLKNPFATRLASRSNLDNWRHRLEPREVDRIRELTDDVATHYYSSESW